MKKITMVVEDVIKNSIADAIGIKSGDKILEINSKQPKDIIEYSFIINDEEINLLVEHKNSKQELYEIEKDLDEDLGIIFTSSVFDNVKKCANHCIFCFVDQQPKGLRESLYVKDDDWRLSYLDGTYITLTNLNEDDWERIEKYHISPLFVSLHTLNPILRAQMTRNPKAADILEQLKRFKKIKTKLHLQIVLCPNYNDGEELKKTLFSLLQFKSIVKSVAVVPLGISKYRKEDFKPVDKKIALETIKIVEEYNKMFKKQVIMASDEFFVLAGLDVPDKKYYGDFLQIEDGVGAIRLLEDSFYKNLKKLPKKIKSKTKLTVLSAKTASNIFKKLFKQINIENLELEVLVAKNGFFGDKINVAGLITGLDIINTIKDKNIENLILPSVMLKKTGDNYEEVFLDNTTLDDIKKLNKNMKIFVVNDCYSFDEISDIIKSFK